MALSKTKFNKYLEIKNNIVYTKVPAKITLDLSEYQNINEEFDIQDGVAEVAEGVYEIPGFFNIEFPNDNDSIKVYLPYSVFLIETENSNITSKIIEIEYTEGQPIFYAKFEKKETDIRILDKLFENGVKYLSNDMGLLVNAIWKQIKATANVPYHHIETILTVLYGKSVNGVFKPVRLTPEQKYCKECALNTKKSAHLFGKTSGFLYGYSNDALLTSTTKIKDKDRIDSFLDKMISGEL